MAFVRSAMLALAASTLMPALALADGQLRNDEFAITYESQGITSLKRVNDTYDTEYLSTGRVLGNVAIQYRIAGEPDWMLVRDVALLGDPPPGSQTLEYSIGSLVPTLSQVSRASGSQGAANLEALSDGQVPSSANPASGARGAAARGATGRRGGTTPPPASAFTWRDQRGTAQWVQYTFPSEQDVSTIQVFWQSDDTVTPPIRVPASWRLLYADGPDFKEVQGVSAYGLAAGTFNSVTFTPVKTTALRLEVTMAPDAAAGIYEWRAGPQRVVEAPRNLHARQSFTLDGGILRWTLALANQGTQPLEIGDLALPLSMAEGTPGGRGQIYTQKLIRHSFIAGNGSWVYWQRANAEGPFLLMVPQGKTGIEYTGSVAPAPGAAGRGAAAAGARGGFTPFIHAAVSSAGPIARGRAAGREQPWRLPITSLTLAPRGSPGDAVTHTFHFVWARDFDAVRDALYRERSIDVNIVPGMTLPVDLPALIALRTQNPINAIQAEFPDRTQIEFVGQKDGGIRVYKAKFAKLGENMLTIRYGDGQWSTLQFFITEPMETVISKRSAFLVNSHQHKDPSKWWYGVYSDWDQLNKVLRSPEDRDGLSPWLTDASDDAGNARPAYVASKNVFLPDQKEIDSVELYIRHYLFAGNNWKQGAGGMQMTEAEPYPYGIYGTFENWYQHRNISPTPPANFVPQNTSLPQDVGWTRLHREHLWRIYDYPHIMLMYYRMYQIARAYPSMVKFANADEYLMLAYNTSVAYWTVPMQTDKPRGWSANAVPTMNEAFLPELILALEREGKTAQAAHLHELWNGKVTRFVRPQTRPNLFGSEFAFDSTGFESTGSMAHYAMARTSNPAMAGGVAPGYTAEQAKEFLEFQLRLNIGDRGWLENTYFQLGSDYRGSLTYLLSYMSQMGGWSVLDYGLHFATDPAPYLRLGYASTLSSWALVNSGTQESGYGFWWLGKENDGAAGGGFMPDPIGTGWIRKTAPRGSWYYSAEEDVGYAGALRAHATILTRDPVFGEFAYGGELARQGDAVAVIPRDGLRARFHVIRDNQRLHLELLGDGFAKEQPILVNDALTSIRFTLENRATLSRHRHIEISGLPAGDYRLTVDGTGTPLRIVDAKARQVVELPQGDLRNVSIDRTP